MKSHAQQWEDCEPAIQKYVEGFVSLLIEQLGEELQGVYLHGSLAMGSFYPAHSDLDLIGTACHPLPDEKARQLGRTIALYAEECPAAGGTEFSLLTTQAAKEAVFPIPYLVHYSAMWHDRILKDDVSYSGGRTDIDLSAHLWVLKRRGVCLYGPAISDAFGEVKREDFIAAVDSDLADILKGKHICDNPCYSILNICRVLQIHTGQELCCLNKEEGGEWGLSHLPAEYRPLVQQALAFYRAQNPPDGVRTGEKMWDRTRLLRLRDYVRAAYRKGKLVGEE